MVSLFLYLNKSFYKYRLSLTHVLESILSEDIRSGFILTTPCILRRIWSQYGHLFYLNFYNVHTAFI